MKRIALCIGLLLGATVAAGEPAQVFKYKIGQRVKVVDQNSLFAGCVGNITDGTWYSSGSIYNVELTSCPYQRKIKHEIHGGEEFFENAAIHFELVK